MNGAKHPGLLRTNDSLTVHFAAPNGVGLVLRGLRGLREMPGSRVYLDGSGENWGRGLEVLPEISAEWLGCAIVDAAGLTEDDDPEGEVVTELADELAEVLADLDDWTVAIASAEEVSARRAA